MLYGPCIFLIMLPSPCTSVTTSSFPFGVDGIAFCIEKASIAFVCEVDVVFGIGDRDLDLT